MTRTLGFALVSTLFLVAGCGGGTSNDMAPAVVPDLTMITHDLSTTHDLATPTGGDLSTGAGDMAMAAAADMTMVGPQTHAVMVGPGGMLMFSPALLTITHGDTVQWTWASTGHSVTSGAPGVADNKFCSPNDMNCGAGTTSNAGATYSHTFPVAGAFPYFCFPHSGAGMVGTITVQ